MSNALFENHEADQQVENTPEPTDQSNLFHVGEGRKFKDVNELDKAYGNANEHIGKLESELADIRKSLEERSSKDDVLDKLLGALKPEDKQEDQPEEDKGPDVEEVVKQLLAKQKAQEAAQSNEQKVKEALVNKYGSKAGEMYKAKATELGVDLDQLTAQSADAVIALFGADKAPSKDVPSSSVDTSTFINRDENDPLEAAYKAGNISRDKYWRAKWREAMKQS